MYANERRGVHVRGKKAARIRGGAFHTTEFSPIKMRNLPRLNLRTFSSVTFNSVLGSYHSYESLPLVEFE